MKTEEKVERLELKLAEPEVKFMYGLLKDSIKASEKEIEKLREELDNIFQARITVESYIMTAQEEAKEAKIMYDRIALSRGDLNYEEQKEEESKKYDELPF